MASTESKFKKLVAVILIWFLIAGLFIIGGIVFLILKSVSKGKGKFGKKGGKGKKKK